MHIYLYLYIYIYNNNNKKGQRVCGFPTLYSSSTQNWSREATQVAEDMAAEESVVESTDFPVKRQRENEENGVSVTDGTNVPQGLSAVIPGWFSEISPMWPGSFSLNTLLL